LSSDTLLNPEHEGVVTHHWNGTATTARQAPIWHEPGADICCLPPPRRHATVRERQLWEARERAERRDASTALAIKAINAIASARSRPSADVPFGRVDIPGGVVVRARSSVSVHSGRWPTAALHRDFNPTTAHRAVRVVTATSTEPRRTRDPSSRGKQTQLLHHQQVVTDPPPFDSATVLETQRADGRDVDPAAGRGQPIQLARICPGDARE